MKNQVLFQETQKFTQWWLWLLILAPSLYIIYKLFGPITGQDFNISASEPEPLTLPSENWTAMFMLFLVLAFIFFMTMKTRIDSEKIEIQHLYFVKRKWYWKDIETSEIIKYGFVGYGIRLSLNHGIVYNVKGNDGLFITLKSGKKRLIGTQKPMELARVIQDIHSNM